MRFDRTALLEFLRKNPDKIPSMSKTLREEIKQRYYTKIKNMSVGETINYIFGSIGLIDKRIIDIARYGKAK
jgi:hypothetical protein